MTETYLSLRKLENEALVLMYGDNVLLDTEENLIKVSLNQFYGIEINDFAVSVAKTALWIAESQMFERTKDLIFIQIDYLPIKSYTTIVNENALRIDWSSVVDKNKLNYIIGNPPFFGSSNLLPSQTDEIKKIFKGYKKVGKWIMLLVGTEKLLNLLKIQKLEVHLYQPIQLLKDSKLQYFGNH